MAKQRDDFSFSFSKGNVQTLEASETQEDVPEGEEPQTQEKPVAQTGREHKQFRILILGDFTGRTNRSVCAPRDLAQRKVRVVDVDNLNQTLAALQPEIRLPVSETAVIPLRFAAMEDFRPEALIRQIQAFGGMLNLRNQLKDNKTFPQAADTVRKLFGDGVQGEGAKPVPPPTAASAESDFEQMLARPVAPQGAADANAEAIIANLVAGYGVPTADPQQGPLVALVEDALSAGLRAVLRHPALQAVEGAWRSVEFLVSRMNTDEDLKLCLLDVSKEELYADLTATEVENTALYQVLVERARVPGAIPFSLVVGDYEFDQAEPNIALLAKMAELMHEAHIPFLAGATAKLPGFASFAEPPDAGKWQPPGDLALWEKLRAHKFAQHVGLAAPRFLLRLPYGPKTDAIEAFPFVEIPAAPSLEQYLWGNGAFAVALLFGQAFLDNGWDDISDTGNDIADLPCHMAVVDGDKEMTPCAQGFLSDRVGDILHQLGIIPLLSVRNAAAVKVAGIHSIAKGKPLAASWGSTS
jgi:type VI secretion system protein ImpC